MDGQILSREAIERSARMSAVVGVRRCPYLPGSEAHNLWDAEYDRWREQLEQQGRVQQ